MLVFVLPSRCAATTDVIGYWHAVAVAACGDWRRVQEHMRAFVGRSVKSGASTSASFVCSLGGILVAAVTTVATFGTGAVVTGVGGSSAECNWSCTAHIKHQVAQLGAIEARLIAHFGSVSYAPNGPPSAGHCATCRARAAPYVCLLRPKGLVAGLMTGDEPVLSDRRMAQLV